MKKKENQEEQLVSSMMEHLAISQPDKNFTSQVMDRVYYEPMPARITYSPLISRTAWIVIGLLLSIYLLYSLQVYHRIQPSLPQMFPHQLSIYLNSETILTH